MKRFILAALLLPLAAGAQRVTPVAPVVLATPVVAAIPGAMATPVAPPGLAPAPPGANLKLWLADPRTGAALPTAIFVRDVTGGGDWLYIGAGADGSVYATLAPDRRYEFDVVEPAGAATGLVRRRYQVTVDAQGTASIDGAAPDSAGVSAVTLEVTPRPATPAVRQAQDGLRARAEQPAADFVPDSPCQLLDHASPARSFATDVSSGFPKVRVRLPSFGHVRALIIPVDFPGIAGVDDPGRLFMPLATKMRDFYLAQSYGKLAFDFAIVPNWVHLPFTPAKYGFAWTVGSGDFTRYRNDIFAMLDGQVDFGRYDAVYILVPPTMPMATMGWGPAITAPTWTRTGYVINGATGGADMYFNRDGAWRWMAHETGHAFGLVDEDLDHRTQTLGYWSIMAMNWSLAAIEHNAWDRYLQGWLAPAQVACLAKPALRGAGVTVRLSPIERQDQDVKAAMVPLSDSTILVMEARRNEGMDRIAPGHEGVLVYTVDTALGSLGGGYRTRRRPGSVDPNFEDAALHPGDTVVIEGIAVTVTGSGPAGDTVHLGAN